jgi:crotonobetainyl-CoA:carnitine CoA-transferase CaiB-like acyl-CoA transferase
MTTPSLPLEGTTVVDLSEQVPGPSATRLLAGLGADVIKVERPEGDRIRARPAMFEAENRGKRSLSLDLKHPMGQAALLRLVESADVLVEGYRPGVMDRLGLGFAEATAVNPSLIYVSISGFGATGPYRDLPAHDYQYLSYAGAIPPPSLECASDYVPTTLPIADMGAAIYAVVGVLLALQERLRSPGASKARHLDVAMADCTLAMMEPRLAEAITEPSSAHALVRPGYGVFVTADQKFVTIGALEDHFWSRLVRCLELPEFDGAGFATYQERRQRFATIDPVLRAKVARFRQDELVALLKRNDVPVAPLYDLHDPIDDAHFRARGMVFDAVGRDRPQVAEWPVVLGLFASRDRLTGAPGIGGHSREILLHHGFGPAEVDELISAGVVRQG